MSITKTASTTTAKTKTSGSKLTAKDKKAAQMAANRKAQMQWWALGGAIAIAAIAAIVLISIYTEGSLGGGHG